MKNQQKKYQTHQIKESNYFTQILEKIKILFQFQYFNFEKKNRKKGKKNEARWKVTTVRIAQRDILLDIH